MNSFTPQSLWHLQIRTPYQAVEAVLALLENLGLEALSWHEREDADPSAAEDDQGFPIAETFMVEGYTKSPPVLDSLNQELDMVASLLAVSPPVIESCQPVDHQDWLSVCYQQLAPRTVGNYYVYGSHDKAVAVPPGLMPLQIDAATAFGSGDHQTTSGCLQAISDLRHDDFKTLLDMGCGSGILAIALAKAWPDATVIAVDNDPESVRVTRYNCDLNDCPDIQALVSEGFDQLSLPQVDLIVANILAKPLCHMAPMMGQTIAQNGWVILSGLLERQQNDVMEAYQREGFKLVKTYPLDTWTTLVLQKG
ncbi:50S ribosomal protein L11 methyltransferase [Candidatus Finniella inopinata]|uniref:Ribosomal protein L11 methyltransferase n=1 Tax=Candidatus Finniella inopinata TaxID=1696036 RepID=A0A4Q7DHA3_9PROT|nr:50S ribosomal protein L11 methyltransferase [Candidatus Finniella inopinata]RZI46143.1 50S ribosomal protein L11 methyltransferase [Candidatus Finniella inopinata]